MSVIKEYRTVSEVVGPLMIVDQGRRGHCHRTGRNRSMMERPGTSPRSPRRQGHGPAL